MNEELKEAIDRLKAIKNAKLDSDSEIVLFEFAENDKYIDLILNYIKILETATNNRYPYVLGGRTLYSKLQQVNKEYLIKDYLRLRNETEQLIKENSISKEVIEKKIENLESQYKEALEENSTQAFILKCQIEILKELLKEK